MEEERFAGARPVRCAACGRRGAPRLAAVSILVCHCWLYSAPGAQRVDLSLLSRFALRHRPAGVLLIFTLSGFLLYRP